MEKGISVILAIYNSEKWLERCINSFLHQSMEDIELICVNDGSTDASGDILMRMAKADSRIVVVNQANQGAAAARNYGLSLAGREYVLFFDSDDSCEPDMLAKMYSKLTDTAADICICNYYEELIDESGVVLGKKESTGAFAWKTVCDRSTFSYMDIADKIFQFTFGWAWDKLYRTEFVKQHELSFQQLRTSNDVFFVFTSLVKAEKIAVINEPLVNHTVNINSSLSATREKSWNCFYQAAQAIREELIKSESFEAVKVSFLNWLLDFCTWNLLSIGEQAKEQVFDCVKNDIFIPWGVADMKESDICDQYWVTLREEIMDSTYKEFLLKEQIRIMREEYEARLAIKDAELENISREYEDIRNSASFKLGRGILYIPRELYIKITKSGK